MGWFFSFFQAMFGGIFGVVYTILTSAKGRFIQLLLLKWYILIMGTAVVVVYNVFKTLQDRGLLDKFYYFVKDILMDIQRIPLECSTKVVDLKDFWDCL